MLSFCFPRVLSLNEFHIGPIRARGQRPGSIQKPEVMGHRLGVSFETIVEQNAKQQKSEAVRQLSDSVTLRIPFNSFIPIRGGLAGERGELTDGETRRWIELRTLSYSVRCVERPPDRSPLLLSCSNPTSRAEKRKGVFLHKTSDDIRPSSYRRTITHGSIHRNAFWPYTLSQN